MALEAHLDECKDRAGGRPVKRIGAFVVRQPHGQPQGAVPEAIAETPVTRWILSARGSPLVLSRSTVERTSFR
jgi:hypothetical protein